jgi:hypothetical protein
VIQAQKRQRLFGVIGFIGMAIIALPASTAFASGTIGGGSAPPSAQRQGQIVYTRSVACRTCAFPGGLTTKEQVAQAVGKIQSGEIALSAADKAAVLAYISRRFGRL